jgi:hypothetical protein
MNAVVSSPLAHTFVRIEDKFLVPLTEQPALLSLCGENLARADVGGARFTVVESIYLDTPDLAFLRDHVGGQGERVKLRVRRYAPNGVFAKGVSFLEAKIKSAGVCTKERFAIDGASFGAIVTGAPLSVSAALIAANPEISGKKLAARVARIEDLRLRRAVMPRVTVRYRRIAFEGQNVRVTLDQDLTFTPTAPISARVAASVRRELQANPSKNHAKKLEPHRTMILEVKHQGARPAWLDEFTAGIGVPTTSFSKYCFAMLRLTAEPTLRLVRGA